jgi:hypothetical protein
MSANYQPASAIGGWPVVAPARVPRGLGERAPLFEAVTRMLLRARQLFEPFKRMQRKEPRGGGGPEEPSEDYPRGDSIWDDPVLWMLIMMH